MSSGSGSEDGAEFPGRLVVYFRLKAGDGRIMPVTVVQSPPSSDDLDQEVAMGLRADDIVVDTAGAAMRGTPRQLVRGGTRLRGVSTIRRRPRTSLGGEKFDKGY